MRRDVIASATACLLGGTALGSPALGQALNFTTFGYPNSTITTVTGLRGNNMTGNYSIANSGGESRRILNGVVDFLINLKPEGSGRITEADTSLWSRARPMDIANRPARWLTTTTLQWGMNSKKVS